MHPAPTPHTATETQPDPEPDRLLHCATSRMHCAASSRRARTSPRASPQHAPTLTPTLAPTLALTATVRVLSSPRVPPAQSEARVPSPPPAYSLTNRSMIGRLKLKDGKKAEAKSWLTRAIELEATLGVKLDETARDAADAARKALKKC
jgi:hypothetical protein